MCLGIAKGINESDPDGHWSARYEPRRDSAGTWLKTKHAVVVRCKKPVTKTKTVGFVFEEGGAEEFEAALRMAFASARAWANLQCE